METVFLRGAFDRENLCGAKEEVTDMDGWTISPYVVRNLSNIWVIRAMLLLEEQMNDIKHSNGSCLEVE